MTEPRERALRRKLARIAEAAEGWWRQRDESEKYNKAWANNADSWMGAHLRSEARAAGLARTIYRMLGICPMCRGTGWEHGGYSHPSGTELLQVCSDCKGTGKYGQT